MSEEQKTEYKEGRLSYITLLYVGKEYVKTFDNEDGTQTKSYKYMFKQNSDDPYSKNLWGYDTTKGADILEEGDTYTIGYIEKPNPKGDTPMKIARFFGIPKDSGAQDSKSSSFGIPKEPRDEDNSITTTTSTTTTANTQQKLTQDVLHTVPTENQLNDFMMAYKKATEGKSEDVNQWIVAYIKSHNRDNKLIPALEQRYAQEDIGNAKEEVVM